jgi:branched-chain amino acid transport system ATP-binding protein
LNPPILATRNLRLDIGGARIVVDVSLEVAEGEFLGIIGPNGAGKTSLFNLLSGIYRPTAGSIQFAGRDITQQSVAVRTREGLGRTFQVSSVFPLLTVYENVRLAAESAAGGTMRIWRRAPALDEPRSRGSVSSATRSTAAARLRTGTSDGSRSRCCSRRTSPC